MECLARLQAPQRSEEGREKLQEEEGPQMEVWMGLLAEEEVVVVGRGLRQQGRIQVELLAL